MDTQFVSFIAADIGFVLINYLYYGLLHRPKGGQNRSAY